MKRIATTFLMIVFMLCLACGEVVVGENPIMVLGDTIYVLPMEDDEVTVDYGSYRGDSVEVSRDYEDGYSVTFEEDIGKTINKVVVTLPNGHVYILPIIKAKGYDEVDFEFSFEWYE